MSATAIKPKWLNRQAACEYTGQSIDTIRRATRATDPNAFPPPLRGKRQGAAANAAVYYSTDELDRWVDSFPDA